MFSRRSDLPLDKDALSQFLPWLIAFMVFLAVIAMGGMLALQTVSARWDKGISGTLTVQITPVDDPAKDFERLQAVLAVLAETPEIARYESLDDDRLMQLLQPWLGPTAAARDLPIPRLIDVELKEKATLDAQTLVKRLQARVPGVAIDDHRVWLDRMVRLIHTVQALASAVLAFIALATVGTVVFTTRTGLAIHREAIEVLHLIGAQDSYVARQFAGRALGLGLKGGIIGLMLALPTLLGIGYLAEQMDSSLIPTIRLGPAHWTVLGALPLVVAGIATVTARLTVLRTLRRML